MKEIKQKIGEGWIYCRVLIEIVGKPKEHVEKSIKTMVEKIKKEEGIKVMDEHVAEAEKREMATKEKDVIPEMWATFAEMEMLFDDLTTITYFCFEYMPSSIEVLEPQKLAFEALNFSSFLNNLQGRLHEVDLLTKQMKNQGDFLDKNMKSLLKNFLLVILSSRESTSEELVNITRVNKEALEDFLDVLVDEGKVEMVGEKYKVVLGGRDKKSS